MSPAKTLLPLVLALASCAAPPSPVARLTVEQARDDWGPVVVTPDPGSVPTRLSEGGVSLEGAGSSR
jgi:hypothetical protein